MSQDRVNEILKRLILFLLAALVIPCYGACSAESRLSYSLDNGVEVSRPLTADEVEALTETGPNGMKNIRPYPADDPQWSKLKSMYRTGDYFVQFWRGGKLVKQSKFYMDGIYLVRRGCIIGWAKGAVS